MPQVSDQELALTAAITDLCHASTDDQIDDATRAIFESLDPMISETDLRIAIAQSIIDGVIMAR